MRQAKLGDFLAKRSRGIVPASTPDQPFELYSVPAFEGKRPEVLEGQQIGSNKQIVDPGTVLLCKINPRINRAWTVGSFTEHQKIASTEWITFPPHPDLDPRYLAHYLSRKEIRDYLAENASGVGGSLMRVKASTVEDLPLPLPTVDEQRRIVAELEKQLSRLDAAVANLKRVITRLTGYRERVLDDAFASEPNTTLGGLISEGPQNGLYLPKDAYGSGTPIVRIDDYQTDWMRPVAELRRVRANESQVSTWALLPGDLLVNRVNSMSHLGKCIAIPNALAGALFESNMMRFRLVADGVPRYIELYLGSRIGKQRLTANAKWAVNQASINQKDVRATAIPLPSRERQAQIVAELDRRLSIVREVETEVNANLGRAHGLRGAVLARAFSATAK